MLPKQHHHPLLHLPSREKQNSVPRGTIWWKKAVELHHLAARRLKPRQTAKATRMARLDGSMRKRYDPVEATRFRPADQDRPATAR